MHFSVYRYRHVCVLCMQYCSISKCGFPLLKQHGYFNILIIKWTSLLLMQVITIVGAHLCPRKYVQFQVFPHNALHPVQVKSFSFLMSYINHRRLLPKLHIFIRILFSLVSSLRILSPCHIQ